MERHVMRVETFGGLAVWLDDQPLVRHGKRINKNLELLALLAINGRAPLSNEALAGLLWTGEESHNPAGTLKNAAYSLRRLLEQRGAGRELITVEDKQYRLAGDLVLEVDLWRAGQLAEQAVNQPDPARALEAWQELDGICCGDFLPQLADRPWVAGQASLVRSGWLAAARRAAALLLDGPERTGARQALAVCAEALLIFPDDMGLQIIRFAAMQRLNMKAAVRSQYPLLAERLMERQGQAPPARLRAIHQWATEGESRGREEMLRIRQKLANHEKNAPPALFLRVRPAAHALRHGPASGGPQRPDHRAAAGERGEPAGQRSRRPGSEAALFAQPDLTPGRCVLPLRPRPVSGPADAGRPGPHRRGGAPAAGGLEAGERPAGADVRFRRPAAPDRQ